MYYKDLVNECVNWFSVFANWVEAEFQIPSREVRVQRVSLSPRDQDRLTQSFGWELGSVEVYNSLHALGFSAENARTSESLIV